MRLPLRVGPLAVDRVLDMYRTSINVWSDSTACAVVARFENAESDVTAVSPRSSTPTENQL